MRYHTSITPLAKVLILSMFMLLQHGLHYGQQPQWPLLRYTPKDGLPAMQCTSVFKDRMGVIWVGTKFGLSRFNGETFENFHIKDGLLGEHVRVVGQDPQGYLWLYCVTRGLVRFDGRHFKQYPFAKDGKQTDGEQIFLEKNGRILVLRYPNGLYQLVGDSYQAVSLKGVPTALQKRIKGFSLTKNLGEYLLKIGADSLMLYQNQQLKYIAQPENIDTGFWAKIYDDVFVMTRQVGAEQTIMRFDGAALQPFMEFTSFQIKVHQSRPYDYIFSHNGHIYLLEKNSTHISEIYADTPLSDSYQSNITYGDSPTQPDAIRYIATEKGLLGLVRNGFKNFEENVVPYTWSVVEDAKGGYYFLNFGHSLQKYDGRRLQQVPHQYQAFIENSWYYNALRDKLGHLWLPHGQGILHHDGKKWTNIKPILTNRPSELLLSIAENKNQNTIVGGYYNLLFFENRPPYRSRKLSGSAPIFQKDILGVAVAPDDSYWFCGEGVARYDSLKRSITYYGESNNKIAAKRVLGLFFDKSGTLWAGSTSQGLFRFNPKKDKFESVFSSWLHGLVSFIEQLDNEHLLIGDRYNLYSVSLKDTTQVRCFNQHNGFMGIEPGQLGSYRDSKGKLWITSGTVLSVLDPSQLDLSTKPLHTNITHIGRNDSLPSCLSFVGQKETIALPFGQNMVSFTVEAIGEDKPFKTEFSYRVKGFLDEWSDWQTQNLITLTNLPNGTFTIEVKARQGVISVESPPASQSFTISIYFWKSPEFYKYAFWIGALLLIGLSYFWYKEQQKAKQIQNQKRQIAINEQDIATQKQYLDDNARKLQQQQKQLENNEQRSSLLQVQTAEAQMNTHFTFNVLNSIKLLIETQDTQEASENVSKLATLIRHFLESSILSSKEATISLYERENELSKEIELLQLYVDLEKLQYKDRFDYEITIDPNLIPENYRIPPLLIQPFVENAIKHGILYKQTKGNLWIRFIEIDEDTLRCEIEDDGVGRQQASEIQANSIKIHKSRGTELIKKRVEILNDMEYQIDIKTTERTGGGTIVTIDIDYK